MPLSALSAIAGLFLAAAIHALPEIEAPIHPECKITEGKC